LNAGPAGDRALGFRRWNCPANLVPRPLRWGERASDGHLQPDPQAGLDPSMATWTTRAWSNASGCVDVRHLVEIGQLRANQGNVEPPGRAQTLETCA